MINKPELTDGEIYIGAITQADGTGNHIILLAGDNNDAEWQAQMDWAKSVGGDLPTRAELILLFEHHREQFQLDWYWSNTQHADAAGYAWCQNFYYGDQYNLSTDHKLRARAVRRVAI